jgi:hypothetical protein
MHRYILRPETDLWCSNIERDLDKKKCAEKKLKGFTVVYFIYGLRNDSTGISGNIINTAYSVER